MPATKQHFNKKLTNISNATATGCGIVAFEEMGTYIRE